MKSLLEFDDAGAQDDEPANGVTVGDIRAWHDQYENLLTSSADWARIRKQERRIYRLIDKLTDILAITQETTDSACWQKIQNIEATAANAIAVDLNILEGDE